MRLAASLLVDDDPVDVGSGDLAQPAGVEMGSDPEQKAETLEQISLAEAAACPWSRDGGQGKLDRTLLKRLGDLPSLFFVRFVLLLQLVLLSLLIWRVCLRLGPFLLLPLVFVDI